MFFHNGILSSEYFPDSELYEVIQSAFLFDLYPLQNTQILWTILQLNRPKLSFEFRKSCSSHTQFQKLLGAIPTHQMQQEWLGIPRSKDSFSISTLKAFDEFTSIFNRSQGSVASASLELLTICLFTNLPIEEQSWFSSMDVPQLIQHLQGEVLHTWSKQVQTEQEKTNPSTANSEKEFIFEFPSRLAPCEDLTAQAKQLDQQGIFPFDEDPIYQIMFDAICRILHRKNSRNVLLVGERGVGKSTIIAELARRAVSGQISFLAQRRFIMIDARFIPADESRQRLVAILEQVMGFPELVVCLNGLSSLLRGDRTGSSKQILLSALTQSRCQYIGMISPREYEELFADDLELGEFFSRVEVEEPSIDTAMKMMGHYASGLENKYQVIIEPQAVWQSVILSSNYILNDQLPAKALKILIRVCEDFSFDRLERQSQKTQITSNDIVRVVSSLTGVPEETLQGIAEKSDYDLSLKEVIFGQDEVVREIATELGLIKAGMVDANKPASVILFLGQTGTGKTEMAKTLARFYSTSKRLKTYTLGNCVEPHSVATIIGVPPGYVGSEQGGRLVNELNADPYCVFLLDEVDKAHPDVLQPFLNLFDEGWVTDQRGVRGYANKAIFILTSNVGQRMISDMFTEGKTRQEITNRMKEALSQIRHSKSERPVFTPEFLARIKRIIVFNSLNRDAMFGIARKHVHEMIQIWLEKRGKQLIIPEKVIDLLGEASHRINEQSKGKEGGRIVRKLFSDWIEAVLQREISSRVREYQLCSTVTILIADSLSIEADPQTFPSVSIQFS